MVFLEYHENLSSKLTWNSCVTNTVTNRIFQKIPLSSQMHVITCQVGEPRGGIPGIEGVIPIVAGLIMKIVGGIPGWCTTIAVMSPKALQALQRMCEGKRKKPLKQK